MRFTAHFCSVSKTPFVNDEPIEYLFVMLLLKIIKMTGNSELASVQGFTQSDTLV